MAKRKTPIKRTPKSKDILRTNLETFEELLKNNNFKVDYYTSGFYNNGHWEFKKEPIQGKMFYDKQFPCESRIVADLEFHKINRHAKIFVPVPKNDEQRKELLAAFHSMRFGSDDFSFTEYSEVK